MNLIPAPSTNQASPPKSYRTAVSSRGETAANILFPLESQDPQSTKSAVLTQLLVSAANTNNADILKKILTLALDALSNKDIPQQFLELLPDLLRLLAKQWIIVDVNLTLYTQPTGMPTDSNTKNYNS
ncbi:hypothetical protein ILUMI_25923 [Ignelater luminosus]|uniref:Uncharacterized protein n=1 Tax=Ignelater luminosus TaxID=2038154 RepID=A0A8K0C9I9_IGNLU|nr:hypothetical protein ILUMI_25923 [Ignelater luminosus]